MTKKGPASWTDPVGFILWKMASSACMTSRPGIPGQTITALKLIILMKWNSLNNDFSRQVIHQIALLQKRLSQTFKKGHWHLWKMCFWPLWILSLFPIAPSSTFTLDLNYFSFWTNDWNLHNSTEKLPIECMKNLVGIQWPLLFGLPRFHFASMFNLS